MWNITITFQNDAMNARSRQAFASAFGYQDTIDGQPNPESRNQFRERKIKEYIKAVTKMTEHRMLRESVPDVAVED